MIKTSHSEEKRSILKTNYIGNLSYVHYQESFIVPVTYFYNEVQNHIICYSSIGHKIDALRKENSVCLIVSAINSASELESVLVKGNYKERSGSGAKAILHQFSLGVKKIILNLNKKAKKLEFINEFSGRINANDTPVIFTIEIEEITGNLVL